MLVPGGADSGRHSAASGRCRADPRPCSASGGCRGRTWESQNCRGTGSWRRIHWALTTGPPGP